jgi:hypothetical protein|tara:strand:+ start:305 stop:880 length:576 start_codon:yes stop_codon:yes gene_type:complete
MKDNVLKKEFSKKDVNRARNLIAGNDNSRTSQGIGYTKKNEHHEEGDVWEEDGREWTIKNGLKQNITKMDKFRKMGKLPLFCPECNTLMKNNLDKKVFPSYQKCFTCIVDYENELRKQGKSEEYFNDLHNQNIERTIEKYKNFVIDSMKESNSNFVTEAGDVENWKGGFNEAEVSRNLQEGLEFLEGLKIK